MKKNHRSKHSVLVLLVLLNACSWNPEGITPIENFEIERYLGTWYEIARLDHSFERGLDNVTAEYVRRDDGGIEVINRGFDKDKNTWAQAVGKAYFTGDNKTGQLRVSFFGPFYSGYNIIELDNDQYQYALVCGPNRNFLWVLSRTSKLAPSIREQLLTKAERLGFDVNKLIYVRHDKYAKPDR